MSKRKRSADLNLSMSSKKTTKRRQPDDEDDDIVVVDLESDQNVGGPLSTKKKRINDVDMKGQIVSERLNQKPTKQKQSPKSNYTTPPTSVGAKNNNEVGKRVQPETDSEGYDYRTPAEDLLGSSFKVPAVPRRQKQIPPPVTVAIPLTSAVAPRANVTKKNNSTPEPTQRQLETTQTSRKLRKAFVEAFQDALEDASNNSQLIHIESLIDNLYTCVPTRPYVFATRRLPEGAQFEDVSEDTEVEEFARWWLLSVTALLFSFPETVVKGVYLKTRDVLAELCQLLICGHPSTVDNMAVQLLKALKDLLVRSANDIDAVPMVKLTLTKTDPDTREKEVFHFDVRITEGNEWLFPHYFHAISPLITRLCYRNIRVFHILNDLLQRLLERSTSPETVATAMIAFPRHVLFEPHRFYLTEDTCAAVFRKILLAPTLPRMDLFKLKLLFSEHQIFQNNKYAYFFQDSGLLFLQMGIREFLYSDSFALVNKDELIGVIMELFKFVMNCRPWVEEEIVELIGVVSSKGLDTVLYPLLEQLILSEFLSYEYGSSTSNTIATTSQNSSPGLQDPKLVSKLWTCIFELWNKSLIHRYTLSRQEAVDMSAEIQGEVVSFFANTASLVKLVSVIIKQLNELGRKETYQFFELTHLRRWSDVAFNSLASGPKMAPAQLHKMYLAILDTLEHLDACRWVGVELSAKFLNNLISIPGWLWLSTYNGLIPQNLKPMPSFTKNSSSNKLQFIRESSILMSKAIRVLRLEVFRPWNYFVSEIYTSIMQAPTTLSNPFLVKEILCAIEDVSWVFKEVIALRTTFTFLNQLNLTTLWIAYSFVRSSLASAITSLPCICYYNFIRNRDDYRLVESIVSRSGCEKNKCAKYVPRLGTRNDEKDETDCEQFYDLYIKAIVKLSLPLLRCKFLLAKLTLSDLIICCHNHVNSPSISIIVPMIEVALNGHIVLCEEIFRKIGLVVMNADINGQLADSDVVQKIFSATIPQICTLKQERRKAGLPLRTREKIMQGFLTFSTVGPMMDLSIFVEILRCVIPIVAQNRGNENSVTILAQKIVTHFSEMHNCQPYELMSRVRYKISRCIVKWALKEFYQPEWENIHMCVKFIERLKYIGKFRLAFVRYFYPPLMELIVPNLKPEDQQYRFLLSALASACQETESLLLQEYIMHYFPSLLLDHSADTVTRCIKFLESYYEFDAMFAAKQQEQRILNEVLCRLVDRQDKVLRFLPNLCKWDEESSRMLSTGSGKSAPRSELQELLSKRLLGFFIHLDTKLQSRIETVEAKEKILRSFTVLMGLMGKSKITPVRSKVYKTLYSATKEGPQFHAVLYEAWKEFAGNLDNASFASMTTQILASMLPLRQSPLIRPKVDGQIAHFVCFRKELTEEYHPELYFLLGQCDERVVIETIGGAVDRMRNKNWSDYFKMIVKEASNDNPPIRYEAFKKLRDVFRFDWDKVEKFVLVKGQEYVSQLISTLLAGLRGTGNAEDGKLRAVIVECFGCMGALDPVRFRSTDDDSKSKNSLSTSIAISGQMNSFVVLYLSELIREFQEVKDTTNFDYCACLIQIVLKEFKVDRNSPNDKVWRYLSKEQQDLITPMFTTKYQMEHGTDLPNLSIPIYLSEHGKTFDSWLINWMSYLIMCIKEKEQQAFSLFRKSMNVLKTNVRVATFIIPFVAMYAVFCANEEQRDNIVTEMKTVLERWVELDKMKQKANSIAAIRDSEVEHGVKEEEMTVENESVFHARCTQVIFSVLDHLLRSSALAKRRWAVKKATEQTKSSSRPAIITPPMTENDLKAVESILTKVQPLLISEVACNCSSFPMALYYLEQELKNDPSEETLQRNVDYLQRLYICLDDMDSVCGIAAIRKGDPSFAGQVLENIVNGRTQESVKALEQMAKRDKEDFQLHQALIRAYLKVEEPHAAETFIKASLVEQPEWELDLQEVYMESLVKLQQWDELKTVVDDLEGMKGNEYLEDKFLTWNVAIPRIISKMQRSQLEAAVEVVTELQTGFIAPLVATCEEMYPYKQAYTLIVQLHILTEIDDAIKLLRKSANSITAGKCVAVQAWLPKEVNRMISKWETRLWNVSRSRKMMDQILSVRKSMLEIMKTTFEVNRPSCEALNAAIRDCWLDMARDASKCGDFVRADNCLLRAKEYMSPQVMIEEAKILSRKGEKEKAINGLQKGIAKYFPQLEAWKVENSNSGSEPVDLVASKLLCSKALLFHAKLCEEQKRLDMEDYIKKYKEASDVYKESEKNFFTMGSYHDRLWGAADKTQPCFDIQATIVRYYSQSLMYGCKYIYQSLPRLLSIWFDFAAGVQKGEFTRYTSSGIPATGRDKLEMQIFDPERFLEVMNSSIKRMALAVPAYILMTAFTQLVSRLCHAHPATWKLLKAIIVQIISSHPNQTLWMTMAVYKSVNPMRRRRCLEIFKTVESSNPLSRQTIKHYTDLTEMLIDLSNKTVPEKILKVSLKAMNDKLPKLIQSLSGRVAIPFQIFLNPSLPRKGINYKEHNPYPECLVYIIGIDDNVDVMTSLVRPKKITVRASNGKNYGLLCKPKDDLRKDSKVMEVNNVVNWYLSQNPDSSQRRLHVRTYSVVPLNEECGLLEWVPNLTPFRSTVQTLYKEKNISTFRGKNPIQLHDPLEMKRRKFIDFMLKPTPPVLSDWFFNQFNDHQSWYAARMSYIRTAAVISIVGYIMGLGDRHGENIMLDSITGEMVHVDFNCIFNKGETFEWPERVPFRLTQNVVDGMGPLKYEGVFRKSCEIVMNIFREHRSIFLSVLRPFVFDPLVEWQKYQRGMVANLEAGEMTNEKAVETMKYIRHRLNGTARNMMKDINTELSVEAQVNYLIEEATSIDNLCQMWVGWAAYM